MWLQLSAGSSSVSDESRAAGLFLAAITLAATLALAACGSVDDSSEVAAADSVAAILEDGIVTDEEYEAAFFRMYDCVVDSGIEVSAPSRDADGQLGFVFYGAEDLETSPVANRVLECEELHYFEVVGVWVDQNGIGAYEGEGNLLECLLGPEVNSMSPEEADLAVAALTEDEWDACL